MSNKADNYFAIIPHWVLFSDLSSQAIRLYCVLRTYADNKTLESWPSRNTLAQDLQVESVKTVDRAIKELVDVGAIMVERRFKNGEPQSNLYTLMSLPSPKNVATTPQESRTNYNQLTTTKELITKPEGLAINDLVALYFDNFPKDRMKPSGARVAGNIKDALKQLSPEKLAELIPYIAKDAQSVTSGAINYLQNQLERKVSVVQATPTPPKYDPNEFENPNAVPMPENFRDMFKKVSSGDISAD